MKLVCGPSTFSLPIDKSALRVVLYGQPGAIGRASAGNAAKHEILRQKLKVDPRAWDFLSLALSVITADLAGLRKKSSDGWTREFDLEVAVADPAFWNSQAKALADALAFLTTDRWRLFFHEGGFQSDSLGEPTRVDEDCVVLLSGGLDSFIGAADLVAAGMKPFAISQTVRGDRNKQADFAAMIGTGLKHLQLNHTADVPGKKEPSQRARSMIFIAFGVLAATTLHRYQMGETLPFYICENGFIAINPPLTGARLGSLSTRTAHPEFLGRLQKILDAADLRVRIENPYQLKTKGEMLAHGADQILLKEQASESTSCGRFQRFNYRHCGRCVPCQIRRAAFLAGGIQDTTSYVYEPLGKENNDHAGFDDVRSVAMAIAQVEMDGLDNWLGATLSLPMIHQAPALRELVRRGLDELKALHKAYGVK